MDTRTALGRTLGLRNRQLAAEWLRQLDANAPTASVPLDTGPHPAATLDEVADAITWITRRIDDAVPPLTPADRLDPLDLLIRRRAEQGRTPGELVLEFRLLGRILTDALVAEVETGHTDLPPARAARIAADLGEGLADALQRIATRHEGEAPAAESAAGMMLDECGRIVTHELIDSLTAAELSADALVSLDFGADPRQRAIALRVRAGLREVGKVLEKIRSLTLSAEEAPRGSEAAPTPKAPSL